MSKMSIRNLIAIICIIVSVMLIACACTKDPAETTSETTASTTAPSDDTTESESESETVEKVTYTVTVVDESNAPLAGATVQLCTTVCLEPVNTNENGVASFTVAEADYTVKVILDGYEPAETTFADGETAVTVVLTKIADETTETETESATTESATTETESATTETETATTETTESETTETESAPAEGENAENPIFVEFTMNDEYTEGTATVTVPAGKTLYFASYNLGEGMILTANGENVDVVFGSMMMRVPSTFSLTNNTDADVEYTLVVTFAPGSMMNPAALVIGENTVVAGSNGYFLTYTADSYCALTIAIDENCTNWTYVINNMTTYKYGDNHYSDDEELMPSETVFLAKGDVIQVVIGTADWTEAEVKFTASTEALGTAEAPYTILDTYAQLPVAAGETVYVTGRFGDMIMTFEGTDVTVVYGEETLTPTEGVITYHFPAGGFFAPPVVLAITNNAETDATYTVSFEYPVGHSENPAEAVVGENTAKVEANSQGYFFSFVAEDYCVFTLTIDEACTNWTYVVNNMTTYEYGDNHASNDEYPEGATTILLAKGDEVQIVIGTADWAEGEVKFTVETAVVGDSAENAYTITNTKSDLVIDAGKTLYISGRFYGMTATFEGFGISVVYNETTYTPDENGIITFDVTLPENVHPMMAPPAVIAITNSGEWEAYCTASFEYPVGTRENPEEIGDVDSLDVSIEAGNDQGYFYAWTATYGGVLTITCPTVEGVEYDVIATNMTNYTSAYLSDGEDGTVSITVAAGDQVVFQISAAPDANWNYPALDVTFTTAFAPAAVEE